MIDLKRLLIKILNKEESFIYDLEKDFKNDQVRFAIKLFSEFGSSIINLSLIVIIGLLFGLEIFSLLFLIYIFQVSMTEVIKFVFKRKRPKTFKTDTVFGIKINSHTGSFPSGHTSNAFCMALLIANLFTTNIYITSILFVVAGLVGVSRIFLGKHFLIDVVGGAIIGMTLTIVGLQLYIMTYSILFLK